MRPVIAILSDFGTRDHYAGTMKGVILNICADATLVDITHDVPAHDVLDGSLQLAAAASCSAPSRTSCAGTSWVMSTRVTSGQMLRMTPFIVPA